MAKYEIKDGVGIIPEGTAAILPKAFDAWMFEECEKELKKVSIPDSVTEIGHYAFRNCRNLVSVEIPESVINIGHHAFAGCWSLKEIKLPSHLKELSKYLLENSKVESIDIPSEVESIGEGAFLGCDALALVKITGKLKSIGWHAFKDCTALKDKSFMEKMEYQFVKHNFDSSWYDALAKCVENDGDTTKFDNDVVSVLKHTEEWHLYANEVNYDEAGIWVHNDDEYPFHFTVVKKGGEVVIEYI